MDLAKDKGTTTKTWRKVNAERKILKKQWKQEKIIKSAHNQSKDTLDHVQKIKQNPSTISIAVPGSILENTQSPELCSYVAGQIARAACIFRVDEIVVFDDIGGETVREMKDYYGADAEEKHSRVRGSSLKLARILQYLECPQYLRKFFFPMHKDLKYAGLLNPLDAPHHLRPQNTFIYREGVVIAEKKAKAGYCYVNVGFLNNNVLVQKPIEPGMRVTVKLENQQDGRKKLCGTVVSPNEPRRETGIYWGYCVRIAHSLSELFSRSPYEGGYDLTIGTSDRGNSIHNVRNQSLTYNHVLIVFGGLKGLEEALANDDKLDVDEPALLFDHYINVLPKQGARTIRTEEALLITMTALQDKFKPQIDEVGERFQSPECNLITDLPQLNMKAQHSEPKIANEITKKRKYTARDTETSQSQTETKARTKVSETDMSDNNLAMDNGFEVVSATIDMDNERMTSSVVEDLSRFD